MSLKRLKRIVLTTIHENATLLTILVGVAIGVSVGIAFDNTYIVKRK
jgi:hypothetical protein